MFFNSNKNSAVKNTYNEMFNFQLSAQSELLIIYTKIHKKIICNDGYEKNTDVFAVVF